MKLSEALGILNSMRRRQAPPFRCFLAAGFNSLHLNTFLGAELTRILPDNTIQIDQGIYGDLIENLRRLSASDPDAAVVLVEWTDLDPRLGVRSTAAWSRTTCADIISNAEHKVVEIQNLVEQASQRTTIAVSLPTLPLPPVSFVPGWQTSSFEARLREVIHVLAAQLSMRPQVRLLGSQRLDLLLPTWERHDVVSELRTGFPYRMPHASILGSLLATLIQRPSPKKAIITDLDDTLWRGLLGEVGVEGISWDLDHQSQMHAFYQRVLGALSSEGVLIGIASKNEQSVVEAALRRQDLALPTSGIFPVEANWGPKSESVRRALEIWNIGPDALVFVDDSPLELAEVKSVFPDAECLQFPTMDDEAIYRLAWNLRDLFGKVTISEEDLIRVESIRRSHGDGDSPDDAMCDQTEFLKQAQSEVSFQFSQDCRDQRALDLVNKTNQFNLNGARYTDAAWSKYFQDPRAFLMVASYKDKYGPLGKVAVIAGIKVESKLRIDTWVMSCRAFSRQIEHRCIEELFSRFQIDQIEFTFRETSKNKPMQSFLQRVLGQSPTPACRLVRAASTTNELYQLANNNI